MSPIESNHKFFKMKANIHVQTCTIKNVKKTKAKLLSVHQKLIKNLPKIPEFC